MSERTSRLRERVQELADSTGLPITLQDSGRGPRVVLLDWDEATPLSPALSSQRLEEWIEAFACGLKLGCGVSSARQIAARHTTSQSASRAG